MVRALVAALLLTAVLAGHAAGAPPGFWVNARLAKPAAFVAGKPVTVYCAYKQSTINATVGPTAIDVQGSTYPGGGDIDLSPLTCAYLTAWLNGKNPQNMYAVAGAMETLAHEAELAKGISDETSATCAGFKVMPRMITKFFPLKKRTTVPILIGYATDFWNAQSALYHAHPC